MEQRHDRQCPVVLAEAVSDEGVDRIPQVVVVGQHRALGSSGGARRVHKAGQVATGHGDAQRPRLAARKHLFEVRLAIGRLAADHHSGAHADAPTGERGAGDIGQVTRPHEDVGPGIGQQIGHLGGGEPEVHGHEDSPELGGGEHRLQEGGAVDQQSGHPVALAHTELAQCTGELVCAPVELGVGDATVPVDQRDTVSAEQGPSGSPTANPTGGPADLAVHSPTFPAASIPFMIADLAANHSRTEHQGHAPSSADTTDVTRWMAKSRTRPVAGS